MIVKILLIFSLLLVSGGGASRRVTGSPGGRVLIKCRYERRYTSNLKYFCKDSWLKCADQIKTGDKNKWVNTGRFSLFDTSSEEFWVLIRDLTVEDSGTYQCGVDKSLKDIYTPVELKVLDDLNREKSITVTGQEGGGVNISCKYPQSLSSQPPQFLSSKPKFLCRIMGSGGCNYKSSVKESRRWIKEGKSSLIDIRATQTFTVSLRDLSEGDSGEYWCGAESDWESDHGYKVYFTQIHLTVPGKPAITSSSSSSSSTPQTRRTTSSAGPTVSSLSQTPAGDSPEPAQTPEPPEPTKLTKPTKLTTSNTPSTSSPAAVFSDFSVISVISVVLVLLLIGLVFFFIILRKRKNSQDTGGSTVYSTVQPVPNLSEPSQPLYNNVKLRTSTSDFPNPIYSSAQFPSNPPDQEVYSTAQLPRCLSGSSASGLQHLTGGPDEGPCYAAVNFIRNSGGFTDAATINKEKDSCDYVLVKN